MKARSTAADPRWWSLLLAITCALPTPACCDVESMKTAYDMHRYGVLSGDYVAAPAPGRSFVRRRGEARPAIVYVAFADNQPGSRTDVRLLEPGNYNDDESKNDASWLPNSLIAAGMREPRIDRTLPLQDFSMYHGQQFEAYKQATIVELRKIFKNYAIVFTLRRPAFTPWFDTSRYMTMVVSRNSRPLVGDRAWLGSYASWDRNDDYRNEVGFAFDFEMNPRVAAIRIAHAVGHMLGLEDTSKPGHVMSYGIEGLWSAQPETVIPGVPPRDPGSVCEAPPPPAPRAQDEDLILGMTLGKRFYAEDGVELGAPFDGDPFVQVRAPSPIRQPPDQGCTFRQWQSLDGQLYALFDCWNRSDDEENVTLVRRPVDIEQGVEVPDVIIDDWGGGGGGSPPPPPDKPVKTKPSAPPESPQKRAERQGKCMYKKGSEGAMAKDGAKTAVWNFDGSVGPGETNCATFAQAYVEAALGQKLAPDVVAKFHATGIGANQETRDQALGLATEATIATAVPGDVVQRWSQDADGHWIGHQFIVASITAEANPDGTVKRYKVDGFNADTINGTPGTITRFRIAAEHAGKPSSASNRRFFVARPNATGGCK
jgi:hypothetical protein